MTKQRAYKFKPSKRTLHITRQMHAVLLPLRSPTGAVIGMENDWRLYELRDGVDLDQPGRGVWVQTRTFSQDGLDAFVAEYRGARAAQRVAA